MALSIDWYRPIDQFKSAMDDMLSSLKNSAKAEGHDRIYTHGEIEFETEQERLQTGIPLYTAYVDKLRELARSYDIQLDV
jgi:LDH2 family malate/lactate/ureidoglycolate dehydrogenase